MTGASLTARARGCVEIRSTNPHEAPAIQPNFLAAERDQRTIVAGLRLCRTITCSGSFARYVQEEIAPDGCVTADDEYLGFARQTGGTIFHPAGTCRMGADSTAVVDDRLRVNGVERLRVVDCSVMPTLVGANTNATAIMIAEKAADLVRIRSA